MINLEMAPNSVVGEADFRRQHEESTRLTKAAAGNGWSSFRDGLTDARRTAVKTIFWLGVLALVLNYREEIADFFVPAAKTVLVRVQHLGDGSKLKQALATPDSDVADITR
jgi:hypothetical protein